MSEQQSESSLLNISNIYLAAGVSDESITRAVDQYDAVPISRSPKALKSQDKLDDDVKMAIVMSTEELTVKGAKLQEASKNKIDNKADQAEVHDEETKKSTAPAKPLPEEDENQERGNWSGKLDFIVTCLGYVVGLANVWRFPFLAYNNGGGAFFIPYSIMLGIVGIPIFFLELSLGQFSSCGPTHCWEFAPLFQGLGYGMMIVSALVSIYYNMIIAWAFYYLYASFTDDLPWEECGKSWSTKLCQEGKTNTSDWTTDCLQISTNMSYTKRVDGACVDTDNDPVYLWDVKEAKKVSGLAYMLPSEQYFKYEVLGKTPGKGLEDFGEMHWELVLCLLLAWVFVALALSKGTKSSAKVVYVTATLPYLLLVILLVRGVTLDGYLDGIKFYITPTMDRLSDAKVWKDAAVQIFFSLSASMGGLITLSSYNRFHNDCLRDSLIVSIGNCLTSLFAGFVIFSFLGFLAHETGQGVEDVAGGGGTGLAFVVYPAAVTKMPISPLWAILFFIMLVTLGVDSEFVLVETVCTSIVDMFPKSRKYKTFVVCMTCIIFFVLGLPLCFDGGQDLLDLLDGYAAGWNVLVISLCECIAVAWVYGVKHFLKDIETMVGLKVCEFMPWAIWKWWWACCWCVLTPIGVTFILIFSWVDYTRIEYLPDWADIIGWVLTMSVIVAIFGTMLVHICKTHGSFGERIRTLTTPTMDWGPALPKHRLLVTNYVTNSVDDP